MPFDRNLSCCSPGRMSLYGISPTAMTYSTMPKPYTSEAGVAAAGPLASTSGASSSMAGPAAMGLSEARGTEAKPTSVTRAVKPRRSTGDLDTSTLVGCARSRDDRGQCAH